MVIGPLSSDTQIYAGQRVQVNGPQWRRVSLALLDVLRRSGPATVVRSCSEMPLFRPGNAPRSAMGSVPIKSVNLNSLPCLTPVHVVKGRMTGLERVRSVVERAPPVHRGRTSGHVS